MYKLNAEDAILVVVDMQDKIIAPMTDKETLVENTVKLIKGCRVLGVPIIASQQYTKGLGPTAEVIQKALTEPIGDDIPESEFKYIEKVSFSCMEEPTFKEALKRSGKSNVIICGIEGHVCVMQTAMDINDIFYDEDDELEEEIIMGVSDDEHGNIVVLQNGYNGEEDDDEDDEEIEDFEVFLACDCISTRNPYDKEMAIKRMGEDDIELMTMESILFEMTGGANNPKFKQISKIVK